MLVINFLQVLHGTIHLVILINITHSHPEDGGPSPDDMLYAYEALQNPDLQAAGQDAINYFKENFSITVVTESGTYAIKVYDWDTLQQLHTAYYSDVTAGKAAWQAEVTSHSGNLEYSDATAHASVKLYGNAVTILKADKGKTNFKPLELKNNQLSNKK